MDTRKRVLFYAIFPALFLLILPTLLSVFFPIALLLILKIACLAFIPCFALILIRRRSLNIIPIQSTWKKLKFWQWVLFMFLIVISVYMLFLGQLCTMSQYMIQNNQITITSLLPWLKQTLDFIFINPIFFPWSFIALCSVIFFPQDLAYSSSLFSQLFVKQKIFNKSWRYAFDMFIRNALLAILCSSVAFTIIQICTFISPKLNIFMQPLPSMIICSLFVFFFSLSRTQRMMRIIAQKKWNVAAVLGSIILLACIVGNIASFIFLHYIFNLLVHYSHQPFSFVSADYFLISANIWITAWWIILAPFLASLIMQISAGRSIVTVLAFLFFVPIFTLHGLPDIVSFLISTLFIPYIILAFQLFSIISLLLLFTHYQANTILRLGYYPAVPLKKIRPFNLQQLILLIICFLGMIGLSGIIGLQLYFGIVAFAILGAMIFVMFNMQWFKAIKEKSESTHN